VLRLTEEGAEPAGPPLAVTKDATSATIYLGPSVVPKLGKVLLFDAGEVGAGDSGGALVDRQGRVVGVILGGTDPPARRSR
jgi:S1-C subfamily serine protease